MEDGAVNSVLPKAVKEHLQRLCRLNIHADARDIDRYAYCMACETAMLWMVSERGEQGLVRAILVNEEILKMEEEVKEELCPNLVS